MSRTREIEWTILFNFPSSYAEPLGYYPTNNGAFVEVTPESLVALIDCKVWSNKKEAEVFAREKCGKYSWKLFPTKILCSIDEEQYKESISFTEDDFYR